MKIEILNGEKLNTKKEVFTKIEESVFKLYPKVKNVSKELLIREDVSTTGFENGIAIPHAKISGISEAMIIIVRNLEISWPSMDSKNTNAAICILVPEGEGNEHLTILSNLSRKLINTEYIEFIKKADVNEIKESLLKTNVEEQNLKTDGKDGFNIVAVTGCTTGIAHTFMAAENIEKSFNKAGHNVKVETRGQGGVGNELTKEEINKADYVIVCSDVSVPLERFDGKKLLSKKVKYGVHHPELLLEEMITSQTYHSAKKVDENSEKTSAYAALMNGVTHMLPFTIAGGIFIALRFFFGTTADIEAGVTPVIQNLILGEFFGNIGNLLFSMMLPVLAAYIAYSKGNRAALMPGALAGLMAGLNGSGFLGAILGGFIAGYIAKFAFSQLNKLPKSIQGSYQILFMPILLALTIGTFMVGFGFPISWLNTTLTGGLTALQDFNPLLLGAVIGAMMAADMGGPINKAAYVTGTLLLVDGNQTFMAAVMAGGMVPPLSIAISTAINKKMYSKEQRDAGISNWILGFSFITEGAIPFAAANPKKVIPALMIGSAVAGSLTMLFKITLPAPHGGIFVLPLVNSPLLYLSAILVGACVGAFFLYVFKKGEK